MTEGIMVKEMALESAAIVHHEAATIGTRLFATSGFPKKPSHSVYKQT